MSTTQTISGFAIAADFNPFVSHSRYTIVCINIFQSPGLGPGVYLQRGAVTYHRVSNYGDDATSAINIDSNPLLPHSRCIKVCDTGIRSPGFGPRADPRRVDVTYHRVSNHGNIARFAIPTDFNYDLSHSRCAIVCNSGVKSLVLDCDRGRRLHVSLISGEPAGI